MARTLANYGSFIRTFGKDTKKDIYKHRATGTMILLRTQMVKASMVACGQSAPRHSVTADCMLGATKLGKRDLVKEPGLGLRLVGVGR